MKSFLTCAILFTILQYVRSEEACIGGYQKTLKGLCKSVDACTGAAINGDCSNNLICCIDDTNPPPKTVNYILTKNKFLSVFGNSDRNNALYHYLADSMQKANINTPYQIAAYVSQIAGETENFRFMESTQIEKDIDKVIGNNQTGDGRAFLGRGGIFLRGKANYILANRAIPANELKHDIVQEPETAIFPSVAFRLAAWFWTNNAYVIKDIRISQKSNLNELADGTFLSYNQLTYSLTNRIQSLKKRAQINEEILTELNAPTMKRGQGITCELSDKQIGYAVPICLLDFKKQYCGCEGAFEILSCPYGRLNNGLCRNSAMIKCCVEKCYTDLDFVILMDGSGSIGANDFEREKIFVKKVIDNLEIGMNKTRVSVIRYAQVPKVFVYLNETTNKENLINAIDRIPFPSGGTNTAGALKQANEVILQEESGMRPRELGIPKVVLTITDGRSNDELDTKLQADRIKKREFNLISVGIGNAQISELLVLSSTPNDQYYVNDFDQIYNIITEISKTTCKQPAEIEEETLITSTIEKNTYKYFKYPLKPIETSNNTFMRQFTIELQEIEGSAELFYSFEENNPKSEDDFVQEPDVVEKEINFYEDPVSKRVRRDIQTESKSQMIFRSIKTKLYQIENPDGKDTLFFSVKGLEQNNSVVVQVYNRTVFNSQSSVHASYSIYSLMLTLILAYIVVL